MDFLLLETSFDALNTKAALYGIQEVHPGFPVMVSVSVSDRSGRTLTGQTIEAFFTAVSHYPLLAFGLRIFITNSLQSLVFCFPKIWSHLVTFFFQTKEPKRPINRYLPHYLNLENHSTSVSSTSGAKVSSMSRYSVGIPVRQC